MRGYSQPPTPVSRDNKWYDHLTGPQCSAKALVKALVERVSAASAALPVHHQERPQIERELIRVASLGAWQGSSEPTSTVQTLRLVGKSKRLSPLRNTQRVPQLLFFSPSNERLALFIFISPARSHPIG